MVLTAIVFLLILSLLVLIHEAGHFFMAKRFGIKVEEFGFGLPLLPKIFSFKRGETEYSIYPALIGGFVKLYGEDEAGAGRIKLRNEKGELRNKKDEGRAFYGRPVWQRAIVVVAGVVMNAILAVVIFYVYLLITGFQAELPLLSNYKFAFANQHTRLSGIVITQVSPDSPAKKAGLTECTRNSCLKVIEVNNKPIESSKQFLDTVKKQKGIPTSFTFVDAFTQRKFMKEITPRVNPPKGQGSLGIVYGMDESLVISYDTPVQRLISGIIHPINVMGYQFDFVGKLIAFSFKEKTIQPLGDVVSGPVEIYNQIGNLLQNPDAKKSMLDILNLAGLLSASLALFNVLPIPGLDGGRLFFILAEGIFGVKMNPKVEGYVNTIGMAFLFLLIILITYKDIMQQFVK